VNGSGSGGGGRRSNGLLPYGVAVAGVAATTAALVPLRDTVNPTTDALLLLLVVLFVATLHGMGPAVVAATAGMLCFNYFFLPPYHTFTIADPQDWVALGVFVVTAVTAGKLSARAKRRAEEAEVGRLEIERLYAEMREAFDRASRAEALRQAEQMKSTLLDAVTHDLRTPLTSIKVSVSALLDELRDESKREDATILDRAARREMLEVIDEETDRLDRFIGNLVDLARIEAGEMHLRRGWVAVGDVVGWAVDRAGRHARTHVVEVSVPEDLPAILADGKALAEVVYTLVDNAAKYSPAGSRIRVSARVEGDRVVVAVEDEGRGIPGDMRERVFDKFFRYAPERVPDVEQPAGTGMGLAIARGIVEAHQGRIWIAARRPEPGTAVFVALPIGDEGEQAEPSAPEVLQEPGS
jgi:two-component system sensor histidine kinase KdpD